MRSSEPVMPGSFAFDPRLDIADASRPRFFQPPQTPSTTASLPHVISSKDGTVRKRPRHGYDDDSAAHFSYSPNEWSNVPSAHSSLYYSTDLASPPTFVGTNYQLAFGLDTPTAATATALEKLDYDDNRLEADYRQNRYGDNGGPGSTEGYFPHTPDPLSREANGKKRGNIALSGSQPGWGKAVFSAVGGVAGKVWNFCWSGAFRGFYAGGGRGYDMDVSPMPVQASTSLWQSVSGKDDVFSRDYQPPDQLPGQFPEETRSSDLTYRPTTPNTSNDQDPEWILVRDSPTSSPSRPSSPAHTHRKVPRNSSYTHARRPSNLSARPISVSFSPRPTKRPTLASSSGSPGFQVSHPAVSRSALNRSATTPTRISFSLTTTTAAPGSPPSSEAKKLAAKLRKKEKEEDASLRRLNDQLKAMIREGKQALGTKFEIEVEDEDEEMVDENEVLVDEGYHEGEF